MYHLHGPILFLNIFVTLNILMTFDLWYGYSSTSKSYLLPIKEFFYHQPIPKKLQQTASEGCVTPRCGRRALTSLSGMKADRKQVLESNWAE